MNFLKYSPTCYFTGGFKDHEDFVGCVLMKVRGVCVSSASWNRLCVAVGSLMQPSQTWVHQLPGEDSGWALKARLWDARGGSFDCRIWRKTSSLLFSAVSPRSLPLLPEIPAACEWVGCTLADPRCCRRDHWRAWISPCWAPAILSLRKRRI